MFFFESLHPSVRKLDLLEIAGGMQEPEPFDPILNGTVVEAVLFERIAAAAPPHPPAGKSQIPPAAHPRSTSGFSENTMPCLHGMPAKFQASQAAGSKLLFSIISSAKDV